MTTTTQTPTGAVTMVYMERADTNIPSVIHLSDAAAVKPASDGTIYVDAKFVPELMRGGWFLKQTTGALPV